MTNSPSPEELALLPCPFCGGEAHLYEGHLDHWKAGCEDCGAATGSWHKGAKAQAAATWNTRTIERLSPPLDGRNISEPTRRMERILGAKFEPKGLDGEGVIQADRDRAVDILKAVYAAIPGAGEGVRSGSQDDHPFVQAFAAHRRAATISTPREDEVERDAERLRTDFYTGPTYDPKARPGDNVLAAIKLALATLTAREQRMREALRHALTFIENRYSDLSPEKRATVSHIRSALSLQDKVDTPSPEA